MKKIIATSVLFCVVISLVVPSAFAVPPVPPGAWEYVFEDAGRIFYMTPPAHTEQMQESFIERFGEERMQIRSGLYYNTEPLESIYFVERFFPQHSIFFSECGTYFAYVHHASMSGFEAGAVWFFESGALTRDYTRGDLLRTWGNYSDVSTFWEMSELRAFDQETNALTVVTAQRRAFTFDITTGEIIRGPIYRPSITIIIVVAVLLTVVIVIGYKLISKRNHGKYSAGKK